MALFAGAVIAGRFRLEEQIGVGAFGAVWRAHDLTSGQPVALKILHDDVASHQRVLERFQLEASLLEQLDHPNIARAIASGLDGHRHYFAMELAEGRTLREDLLEVSRDGGLYRLDDVLSVFGGMARGLDVAHKLSIIHRDIKPSNIMVAREHGVLEAKILDFGIAKVTRGEGDQTTVGRRLGTLSYMSPEQLVGQEIDARSDIFALGVLLFEMLTSRRPFLLDREGQPLPILHDPSEGDQNSFYEVTRRVALGTRPRVTRFRAQLKKELDEILQRALHPMMEERFASALELYAAVDAALELPKPLARSMTATSVPEELTEIPTDVTTNPARTRILPPPPAPLAPPASPAPPAPVPGTAKTSLRFLAAVAVFVAGIAIGLGVAVYRLDDKELIAPAAEKPARLPSVVARAEPEAKREVDPQPEPDLPAVVVEQKKTTGAPAKPKKDPATAPAPEQARSVTRELLSALDAAPNDPRVVTEVAQKLEREAAKLTAKDDRLAIQRCATLSALRADARELAVCIQSLDKLTGGR